MQSPDRAMSSSRTQYRFAHAWLPTGWQRDVVVAVEVDGTIAEVILDHQRQLMDDATHVKGAAIPGMPNVHGHAFQRAMTGLAEHAHRTGRDKSQQDSFWTWRETMYEHASRMSPGMLEAIAAQLYVEMIKAGYTTACEFHYLHNRPDGRPYDDPLAMHRALWTAADRAGIGLTLLPTLYQTADFGGVAPTLRQRQFVLETHDYLDLVRALQVAKP